VGRLAEVLAATTQFSPSPIAQRFFHLPTVLTLPQKRFYSATSPQFVAYLRYGGITENVIIFLPFSS